MPIISVAIIKIIDEREMQKATKEKQTKTEAIVKGWELNDFVVHLSQVFSSNLELALSIILKQRALYE